MAPAIIPAAAVREPNASHAAQRRLLLEMVERNFAAGTVPLLDPAALDVIIRELATRPLN